MASGGIETTQTMPDRILSTATRLRDVAAECFEDNKACGRQPLLLPANKHHAPRKTRAVLSDVKQKSGKGETTGQVKRHHAVLRRHDAILYAAAPSADVVYRLAQSFLLQSPGCIGMKR